MPKLIVLRHAKAVAGFGLADIDRTLADRGLRDAAATGNWLRENGLVPDRVLCSTAVRTRQTLAELDLQAPAEYSERIYDNDPDVLLGLLRETGDEVGTLLLIGHNPSLHLLIHDLAGEAPDSFPTCALALLDLQVPWTGAAPGTGVLRLHRTPKD